MPDNENPAGEPLHEDVRYEPGDVRLGPVLAFGLGLVALGIAAHFGISWLLTDFARQEKAANPPLPAIVHERPRLPGDLKRIPEPRLEESEGEALRELRNEEETRLHTYGWVDPKAGVVRIPIDEAMRLLSEAKTAERHGIRVRSQLPK